MARTAADHLRDALEAIEAIETYTRKGKREFERNPMLRDAVVARLIQIGQAVKDAQAAPDAAAERVRAHIARIGQSPTPGYQAYSDDLIRQGCAQFAQLHNTTSPEQRADAERVLKGYEEDLRVLSAQR